MLLHHFLININLLLIRVFISISYHFIYYLLFIIHYSLFNIIVYYSIIYYYLIFIIPLFIINYLFINIIY